MSQRTPSLPRYVRDRIAERERRLARDARRAERLRPRQAETRPQVLPQLSTATEVK